MVDLNEFKKLLSEADIIDANSPVSGTLVWLEKGCKLRHLFTEKLRTLFESHNFSERYFPLMVSTSDFNVIKNNVYDFSEGVMKIDEGKILRPTGEGVIYPMFKHWITSYKDLPIRVFQFAESFRRLTPRGLWKLNESDLFIEGHTAHQTSDEANAQLNDNVEMMVELLRYMCIPILLTERPIVGNKPVATTTIGADTLLPSGETLQVASTYNQSQIYSKAFSILFRNEKNTMQPVYQTCVGFVGAKVIFTSLLLSADEKGLNIPPIVAPIQVRILPIISKTASEQVKLAVKTMLAELENLGLRADIDFSNNSIGAKRYACEREGIPVRIEIGNHELEKNKVTLYRREGFKKYELEIGNVPSLIRQILKSSEDDIIRRITQWHSSRIISVTTMEDIVRFVDEKCVVSYPSCASQECINHIEGKSRGEVIGFQNTEKPSPCIVCHGSTNRIAFHARRI